MVLNWVWCSEILTAVNDHHLCNPDSPTGCLCCSPLPLLHCCDMCDPEFFAPFHVQALASTSFNDDSNASGSDDEVVELSKWKSTLKCLKVTEDVVTFRRVLYTWRLEMAEAKYGAHIIAIYGSHMIMSDAMIDHIIACAKAAKLPTVQHLVKETGWWEDLANIYGKTLLIIVHQCSDKNVLSTPAATRVMHCSTCRKPGHNHMAIFLFSPLLFSDFLHFKASLRNASWIKSKKMYPHPVISPCPSCHPLSLIKCQRCRASWTRTTYLQIPSHVGTSNQSNQSPVITHSNNSNSQVNSNSTHNSRMFSLD